MKVDVQDDVDEEMYIENVSREIQYNNKNESFNTFLTNKIHICVNDK